MNNDKIKAIVRQAKDFMTGEATVDELAESMVKEMGKAPTLALGIIDYLEQKNYLVFETARGPTGLLLNQRLRTRFENLSPRDLSSIRIIAKKLFEDQSSSSSP